MRHYHIVDFHMTDEAIVKFAKHGLTIEEVKEAVIWDPDKTAVWEKHKEHGGRLKVIGRCESNNKVILAFLDPYEVADGIWKPRTAYRVG